MTTGETGGFRLQTPAPLTAYLEASDVLDVDHPALRPDAQDLCARRLPGVAGAGPLRGAGLTGCCR